MARVPRLLGCIALASLLAACAGPQMAVDKPETKPLAEMPPGVELDAVEFAKVIVKISRGTKIGTYEAAGKLLIGPCKDFSEDIFWNSGRVRAKGVEFADIFHEELTAAGYDVVGDPTKIFVRQEDLNKALYAVGAQINEIKMHVCDHTDFWEGTRVGRQSGEASVKVKWQVLSKLSRRVIYETSTAGHATLGKHAFGAGVPNGEIILIQQAFGAATANLAAETGFRDLLIRKDEADPVEAGDFATLEIPRRRLYTRPIASQMDDVVGATVTISLGDGFGSGFVVSKDGLILTNHHVVGKARRVRVIFPSGLEIDGEVLRSHERRDVALVKVTAGGLRVLPMRRAAIRIGEEIYAVGTPMNRELRATVTKGIVSAVRVDKRTKLERIQGDVDVQSGNSGGPLLDARGNVVGITVSSIATKARTSIGINFFIPINDALEKLNMSIATK